MPVKKPVKKVAARPVKKSAKKYTEMNTRELAAATAEFNADFDESQFRPMTAAQRARWAQVKRQRGRPVQGAGAKVVSVSLERGLLARADKKAKQLKISRAKLIARGLEALLK